MSNHRFNYFIDLLDKYNVTTKEDVNTVREIMVRQESINIPPKSFKDKEDLNMRQVVELEEYYGISFSLSEALDEVIN